MTFRENDESLEAIRVVVKGTTRNGAVIVRLEGPGLRESEPSLPLTSALLGLICVHAEEVGGSVESSGRRSFLRGAGVLVPDIAAFAAIARWLAMPTVRSAIVAGAVRVGDGVTLVVPDEAVRTK